MEENHERLNPELQAYRQQFEAIKRRARQLVSGLTERQMLWRPAPDRWSIGKCLSHLNATAFDYFPAFERVIERARSRGRFAEGPYRHGFLGNWLVRFFEPPPKMPLPGPRRFAPREDLEMQRVISEFENVQHRWITLLYDANGLDLGRVKMGSTVTPLLRLDLGQWFGFHAAHERRHLWQAEQVRQSSEFPQNALPSR